MDNDTNFMLCPMALGTFCDTSCAWCMGVLEEGRGLVGHSCAVAELAKAEQGTEGFATIVPKMLLHDGRD
ncbi:MAG: hypothetical protein IJ131_07015 [Eggerthellaceae bacterium]|nr:hypothetical protein [Eggerthellaceae bacterium]